MTTKLLESGEMYLETIFVLLRSKDCVRAIDVAEYMSFSKPSVSIAMSKLKDGGFILIDSDGHISLTDDGRTLAEKIYERHTTLTEFLTRLGVDKDIAAADACKIEHDISDESFEAIKRHTAALPGDFRDSESSVASSGTDTDIKSLPYHFIDMENYPRLEHFNHFCSLEHPFYATTVTLDITGWMKYIKEKGYPFFLSFLYTVGRAAASVPQFRQRILDGRIVEYDSCLMSYTVARPDETYRYCNVRTDMPFNEFLPYAQELQDEAMQNEHLADECDVNQLMFVSSVPWLSFDSIAHIYPDKQLAIPDIIWGRYYTEEVISLKNGQPVASEITRIPLSAQVHHALVDGLHLSRFFTTLQEMLNSPDF